MQGSEQQAANKRSHPRLCNPFSRRFIVNDCKPICCSRQNAKYPTKRFGAMKWAGAR